MKYWFLTVKVLTNLCIFMLFYAGCAPDRLRNLYARLLGPPLLQNPTSIHLSHSSSLMTQQQEPLTERCKNCGTTLNGAYCYRCGQKHLPETRSLKLLLMDALDHIFSLDNTLLRTLATLIKSPGKLTQEYLMGRRVRYTFPLRLYLIVSFVYFFVTAGMLAQVPVSLENPQVTLVLELLPKILFFMVPVMALLLKILYRPIYYFEHLIFSLHIHAITFVFFSLRSLLQVLVIRNATQEILTLTIIVAAFDMLIQLGAFVYFIAALRKVYGQTLGTSIGKGMLLGVGYIAVLAGIVTLVAKY